MTRWSASPVPGWPGRLDCPGIGAWLVFSQFTSAWFLVSQEDIQSQAQLDVFVHALAVLGRYLGRGLAMAHQWDIRP